MELPKRFKVKNYYRKLGITKTKEYNLVKLYKNFGLYKDENGFTECFTAFDIRRSDYEKM